MPIQSYSTIIWDWNGTLIDDIEIIAELVSEVLVPLGLEECTVERYREAYTHPIKNAYAALGAEMSNEEYASMTVGWLDNYERARTRCSLQQGAREALQALKEKQKQQYLLSAHRHDLVLAAVGDFALTDYFEKILGLEDGGGHGKVETGKSLIEEIGVPIEEVLFVGDSYHDHEVAAELGADCHLVARGADALHKLEKSGRPVFDSLQTWSSHMNLL